LGNHAAVGHVESREQRRRAVPEVIVGHTLDIPRPSGRIGWLRSSAWIWLFSSTHRTARSGAGSDYSPTMSRTFSTKKASVDNLKIGYDAAATKEADVTVHRALVIPVSSASERTVQWVAPFGFDFNTLFSNPAIRSSSWVRGRPTHLPMQSGNACRRYRPRQKLTSAMLVPIRARSAYCSPRPQTSTPSRSSHDAVRSERDLPIPCSCSRSLVDNARVIFGRLFAPAS